MTDPTNAGLFTRAQRVIPGGVNSPVRAFNAVGGAPYFVQRAQGPFVWDVEGNRLIDFVQSYGAIILGHAHPAIVGAVQEAAAEGTSYGAPTEREVLLAEAITARVDSVDKVRLVSSGTEATMTAIRIARGFTGKDKMLKFAGCYHGHSDALLVEGGSALAALGLPGSAGVTVHQIEDTIIAPFNVVPELGDDVACVIIEPVAANMGLVPPVDGFLAGLRAECDRVGALLIFDEVITGLRLGATGAQGALGVRPDLTTFGKVIGGGLPIGAVGGRADVMDVLAPVGPVYQAGTLSGNPLATAAGLAALELLEPAVYDQIEATAQRWATGLAKALADVGVAAQVPCVGTLVGLFLGPDPATDYESAKATDEAFYARFFHALLDGGVAIAPGAYEVMFPGFAHSDDIIDEALVVVGEAARRAAGSTGPR